MSIIDKVKVGSTTYDIQDTATKAAVADLKSAITYDVNSNGTSLITLKNTVSGNASFTLSGNSGETKVVSCGENLANVANLELGKNWSGSDHGNRARIRIKVKPATNISIKYSGINSSWEVAAFELKAYDGSTAATSHALTYNTGSTFETYGDTEWIALLINKGSTINAEDVENLVVYCNEGTEVVETAYVGDSVTTSSSGSVQTYNGITHLYSLDDSASIAYEYSKYTDYNAQLIVCGNDANELYKSIAEKAQKYGFGYVCGANELDSGVNAFIDRFIDIPCDIYFYGTIGTSEGIHKHPKHNLNGYHCTLKMGAGLGTSYVSNIFCTSGGLTFEQQQVISHGYTYVKGFTFDGNTDANKVDGNYVFSSVYGGCIMPEIYNEQVSPYSKTQSINDLILEDIKARDTMRGIIVGTNWKCRNLEIGASAADHALYLAGADNATVENVYITGRHQNGAVAISPQSWVTNRRVKNVSLQNVLLDECVGINGPLVEIRGHFSNLGNNAGLNDVFIDGLYIKNQTNAAEVIVLSVGTQSSQEVTGSGLMNYPTNIKINNFVFDGIMATNLVNIKNANLQMRNARIVIRGYNVNRPLFKLQSKNEIRKAIDVSGLRLLFWVSSLPSDKWVLFGLDNSDSNYNMINGLNLSNSVADGDGNSNVYLFGLVDGSVSNAISLNDVNSENLMIYPSSGNIKAGETDRITISQQTYNNV